METNDLTMFALLLEALSRWLFEILYRRLNSSFAGRNSTNKEEAVGLLIRNIELFIHPLTIKSR